MDERKNETKEFGYAMGRAFGVVLVGCLTAIIVATTVRIVMWII